MNELLSSMPSMLAIVGIVLIIIEMAVFGFSTLFLLFIALGCFSTALLMNVGIMNEHVLTMMLSVGMFSLIWAVILWKPLRRLQSSQQSKDEQPNLINGLEFDLSESLRADNNVTHQYSGVQWQVFLADKSLIELPEGSHVKVIKSSVGKLFVAPVE